MSRHAALEAARGQPPTAKNIERVASAYGQAEASWAFSQWALRSRATAKFAKANEMLFTATGLEQATHEAIARYHASRFPSGKKVADLTAGIGADLIALAARGPAIGYEIDQETIDCAAHNAPGAELRFEDCMAREWDFAYAFADPARRVSGKRVTNPDQFQPDPAQVAERMWGLKLAGIKLSPMLSDAYLAGIAEDIEFISFGGECREAVAWFGTGEQRRCARRIETGAILESGGNAPTTPVPGGVLYEANPASIRAHCLPALCEQLGASLLGDSNGYLSGDTLVESEWVRAFRVLEFGSFDEKRVRSVLTSHGGGTPEIKARVKVDIPKLRRRLSTSGAGAPLLVLYPEGKSIRFMLVERA